MFPDGLTCAEPGPSASGRKNVLVHKLVDPEGDGAVSIRIRGPVSLASLRDIDIARDNAARVLDDFPN
ncbi:MAG: hypothetical protein ABSB49_13240 [Polyangia bacterium]|jgi:hypothetical protein